METALDNECIASMTCIPKYQTSNASKTGISICVSKALLSYSLHVTNLKNYQDYYNCVVSWVKNCQKSVSNFKISFQKQFKISNYFFYL